MTEHPEPEPREHPRGAPREHPTRPAETPEKHDRDPIDSRIDALRYRPVGLVLELLGTLEHYPAGLREELLLETVSSDGPSRSTIENTITELTNAGAIQRIRTGRALRLTPLGRAWAYGRVDGLLRPDPQITPDGALSFRWHTTSHEDPTEPEEVHP